MFLIVTSTVIATGKEIHVITVWT